MKIDSLLPLPNGKILILGTPIQREPNTIPEGNLLHTADSAEAAQAWIRLEYLRGELKAERISYGELAELQSLVKYIDADDVELRQAAGIDEDSGLYSVGPSMK